MSTLCGCCYRPRSKFAWAYLPQVSLKAHATVLSSAARTTLTQTFLNPSKDLLEEVSYTFPLYDGVSVVGFTCHVGSRALQSQVKSKEQANAEYQHAVDNNKSAGILDHSSSASDVFTIRLGNVPAGESVTVHITFVGELKQDAQTDGIRYTLPNVIAPRYGLKAPEYSARSCSTTEAELQGISITVDVLMEATSTIREIHSPSHAIRVALGRIASVPEHDSSFTPTQASATLNLARDIALLERDFVMIVKADGLDTPRAMLESHPTLPDQRALMASLVPKFSLPPAKPEVVFIIDRSGSMEDKIETLQSALKVFLKSLPVDTCFNICSFGSSYSLLWKSSRVYDASSLEEALDFVDGIYADMGGTEMQSAVEAVVDKRLPEKDLEVLLLTDGEIWNQDRLFNFVRESSADHSARFFTLGIGDAASHSLIEGVARAGNGFSQSVTLYEELDKKVVRMLKGAISPHIYDYKLDIEYEKNAEDDFEVIEAASENSSTEDFSADSATEKEDEKSPDQKIQEKEPQKPISLFDSNFKEPDINIGVTELEAEATENVPAIEPPQIIQAPHKIPTLYPFIRTNVYILIDPRLSDRVLRSVTFRATSKQGPLVLQIPISDVGRGETIHQLAVRKAVVELEEGHGWLSDALEKDKKTLGSTAKQRVGVRECQRLCTRFQITGKHCSFVALEKNLDNPEEESEKEVSDIAQVSQTQSGQSPGGATLFCSASAASASFNGFCKTGSASGSDRKVKKAKRLSSANPFQSSQEQPLTRSGPMPALRTENLSQSPAPTPTSTAPQPQALPYSSQTRLRNLNRDLNQPSIQPPTQPSTQSSSNPVHAILDLQTFQGYWEWTPAIFNLLRASMEKCHRKLVKLCREAGLNIDDDDESCSSCSPQDDAARNSAATVIVTFLAMGALLYKNADSRDAWELVYAKADDWTQRRLRDMGSLGVVLGSHKDEIMAFKNF